MDYQLAGDAGIPEVQILIHNNLKSIRLTSFYC